MICRFNDELRACYWHNQMKTGKIEEKKNEQNDSIGRRSFSTKRTKSSFILKHFTDCTRVHTSHRTDFVFVFISFWLISWMWESNQMKETNRKKTLSMYTNCNHLNQLHLKCHRNCSIITLNCRIKKNSIRSLNSQFD